MAILEAQTRRMMAEDDFDAVDTGTAPAQQTRLGGDDADEQAERRADAATSKPADEQDESDESTAREESAAATLEDGTIVETDSESRDAPSETVSEFGETSDSSQQTAETQSPASLRAPP